MLNAAYDPTGFEIRSISELKKVSARLRKRFQLLKQELRRRAQASGLLEMA